MGKKMTIFEEFKNLMPSPSEVVEIAIANIFRPPRNTPDEIKRNFSDLVEELQREAYRIYLAAESEAGCRAFKNVLSDRCPQDAGRAEVIETISGMFQEFNQFYLSLIQSRKPRAGSAFETILKRLFRALNYPFEEQPVINGKPDFVMPSKAHFDRNPMDCIIFTVKRSLRERWRQIVTEGTRGLGFYLATIDETVSSSQLEEIRHNRIYVVLPRAVKIRVPAYTEAPNVITFEEFFEHHLDPALNRWRAVI